MDEPNPAVEVHTAAASREGSRPITQVFSGVGLGLLLGIIAGLSVSPVVQVILGALVTVVTGFLSLQGGSTGGASGNLLGRMKMNELRIGSFGLACVVGIMFGLFIRSNTPFVSVDSQVKKWTAAGYPEQEARQYVAFQTLGIKPEGKEVVAGDIQKASGSALFAGQSKVRLCGEIDPSKFGDDPRKVLSAFKDQGDAKLTQLADEIQNHVSPEHQETLLKASWEVLCELEKSK